MTHDTDPGPLASIALLEGELGLSHCVTPSGDAVTEGFPVWRGYVPAEQLADRLRTLAPRACVVLPVDLAPRDPIAYATAHGAILGILGSLAIPVEMPPASTGYHHESLH